MAKVISSTSPENPNRDSGSSKRARRIRGLVSPARERDQSKIADATTLIAKARQLLAEVDGCARPSDFFAWVRRERTKDTPGAGGKS